MINELLVAFTILAICIVLHTGGMVICAQWLFSKRESLQRNFGLLHHTALLISVCAFVITLHLVGTGIWAMFYWQHGLFENFETALYFSVGSYTTIGYGDVVLPQRWRLLGGIEGLSGVLLCGLSTAFIFAIVNVLFQMRMHARSKT